MCSKTNTIYTVELEKQSNDYYSFRKSIADKLEFDFVVKSSESQSFEMSVECNLFYSEQTDVKKLQQNLAYKMREYCKINRVTIQHVNENHGMFEEFGESICLKCKVSSIRDSKYLIATMINEVRKCLSI